MMLAPRTVLVQQTPCANVLPVSPAICLPVSHPQSARQLGPQQPASKPGLSGDCGCGSYACAICNKGQAKPDVCCVSLGSYCGVSGCLRGNDLRSEAFPFDWMRSSLEGILHFLETGFQGFLEHNGVKDFPHDTVNGGLAYCGKYHSFWHDDLRKKEVHEKYKRRIERIYNNPSQKLLFIRAINESSEVLKVHRLLEVLQRVFPNHDVWLLIIVDHQSVAESYVLQGTHDRLLIHTTDKQYLRGPKYQNDFHAYDQAILRAVSHVEGRTMGPNVCQPRQIQNLQQFAAQLEPYFGGNPQEETWDPWPIPPQVGMGRSHLGQTGLSAREVQLSPSPASQDWQGLPRLLGREHQFFGRSPNGKPFTDKARQPLPRKHCWGAAAGELLYGSKEEGILGWRKENECGGKALRPSGRHQNEKQWHEEEDD